MRFWVDFPLEQWIQVREDKHHKHPWYVEIAGWVRARYTTEKEARDLVDRIHKAFEEPEVPEPKPKPKKQKPRK